MKDRRVVTVLMEIASSEYLFFVDSKTTAKSLVFEIAREINVPCLARDVFLDNTKNREAVKKQLNALGDIALKRGYAIGIGHVGPEGGAVTAQAIAEMIPVLRNRGAEAACYGPKPHQHSEEAHGSSLASTPLDRCLPASA